MRRMNICDSPFTFMKIIKIHSRQMLKNNCIGIKKNQKDRFERNILVSHLKRKATLKLSNLISIH